MRSGDCSLADAARPGPGNGIFEPVVSPEQFVSVHDEGWGAENAQAPGGCGLIVVAAPYAVAIRLLANPPGVLTHLAQTLGEVRVTAGFHSIADPMPVSGPNVFQSPVLLEAEHRAPVGKVELLDRMRDGHVR